MSELEFFEGVRAAVGLLERAARLLVVMRAAEGVMGASMAEAGRRGPWAWSLRPLSYRRETRRGGRLPYPPAP